MKKDFFKQVSFEELVIATGGYGVVRIALGSGSPLLNQSLADSGLREQDITVLAIVREGKTQANPPATAQLLLNDELLCFGKLGTMKQSISMQSTV